jgi:GDP-L-fucose synthase
MAKEIDLSKKRVTVTGADGFLGKHLVKELKEKDINNLFLPNHTDYDLTSKEACKKVAKESDIIIHLAAKVGGIGANMKNPGSFFYDNLMMGVQLIEEARCANVEKFVALGTVCAYPKFTSVPFKETDLWLGYPEETNAPYGLAKKMLLVQLQSYKKQYDFNGIYLLPVNLYGPGDNFDPLSSHVIPAMIRKFVEAKENNLDKVEIWGTGNASREFLFVKDAAKAITLATKRYSKQEPCNLGSGMEINMKDLALKIKDLTNYSGEIVFDSTKPDGQPRRCLDVKKAKEEFGFTAKTNFDEGLKETINWWKENQ